VVDEGSFSQFIQAVLQVPTGDGHDLSQPGMMGVLKVHLDREGIFLFFKKSLSYSRLK
jgi:hypothetical protein